MAQSGGAGALRSVVLGLLNILARTPGKPAAMASAEVRRILVVELWNIGDVVLLLPFLTQLRLRFPNASVTLLARPHARVILANTGLVDEFLDDAEPAENWLSLNPLLGGWRDLWRLRRQLRERDFDIAFQCRLHVREHVILAMSGARRRIGYAFGEGDRMLTDALHVDNPHRRKVEDWLRLLSVVGGPVDDSSATLRVAAEERKAAEQFLAGHGVRDTDILIGLHPGASLPEKRWPLERFAAVARELVLRNDVRVIAFADPYGYGSSLGDVEGVVVASTTLRQLIATIDRCALLVCNDSGPMHIAGGLGVRTVAIFGSGVDRWFAPLGEGHELISAESESGVENIPVDRVLDAVDRMIAARSAPGTPIPSTPQLSPS